MGGKDCDGPAVSARLVWVAKALVLATRPVFQVEGYYYGLVESRSSSHGVNRQMVSPLKIVVYTRLLGS